MRIVLAVVWLLALCLPVNAQETVQRFDTNGSGTADQREFYDAEGVLQRVTSDEDGNGTFEQQLFYGADKQLERLEKDINGDGNPDQWQTFEQGKVARIALDQDFNGKP